MGIVLYGIPNCDTVKKARVWLERRGVGFTFHDFKKAGLERATVESWLADLPWEVLVNRKGTTWRQLDEARKAAVTDAASAADLMLAAPSVVKRPVLALPQAVPGGRRTHCGFSDELYGQIFGPGAA